MYFELTFSAGQLYWTISLLSFPSAPELERYMYFELVSSVSSGTLKGSAGPEPFPTPPGPLLTPDKDLSRSSSSGNPRKA